MSANRRLIEFVDDTRSTPEITVGHADRTQRKTPGQHVMLSAKGGNLEATAAEIEGHDIGISLIRRIRPDARASQTGFDLAGNNREGHTRHRTYRFGEDLAVGAFPDGARTENGKTRSPLGAGKIEQTSDRRSGGGLGISGKRVARIDLLLQADGFGQPTEFATVLLVHDGDLDGIGTYVDNGDGRHVQNRN